MIGLAFIGIGAFHVAYAFDGASLAITVFLYCLISLTAVSSSRRAFYTGLAIGLAIYAPQLGFFWSIFGMPAVTLWLVLAFWIGLFLALSHCCNRGFGPGWTALLAPFLWTGLEYFRSELYYLRFSWLSAGFALSELPGLSLFAFLGVYGMGFALMCVAAVLWRLPRRIAAGVGFLLLLGLALATGRIPDSANRLGAGTNSIVVAGVQVEFPAELEVPAILDRALQQAPDADLFMLSEYTFDGPPPPRVKDWCRKNQRHLVVGGKDPVDAAAFYNTAFVIGPTGELVFQQAKSVPIQFFKDGMPAKEQRIWDSPWGKLGICICYDLSYSRVSDRLIRQGAQALLVPTMDVTDWGQHQHDLHARVAPLRAAEYQVPIFRVTSSGVSQLVDASGTVSRTVPFPDQGKVIFGRMILAQRGRMPADRYLAPVAAAITGFVALWMLAGVLVKRRYPSDGYVPKEV